MTQRPNTVRILSRDYKIEWVDSLDIPERYGYCYAPSQTIKVASDEDIATDIVVDTVIHEALHGITSILGIEDGATEEETVSAIATGLTTILKDSPQLIEWCIEQLADRKTPKNKSKTAKMKSSD